MVVALAVVALLTGASGVEDSFRELERTARQSTERMLALSAPPGFRVEAREARSLMRQGSGAPPTGEDDDSRSLPGFSFSADGGGVARSYAARGSGRAVSFNGSEVGVYGEVRSVLISPDGRRVAVVEALAGGRLRAGEGEPVVDEIADGSLTFSPDGKRLAYVAVRDGRRAVWVDRKEGPACVDVRQPRFSGDGKHIAYASEMGDGWAVMLDGKRGPTYESVDDPVFSGDGRQVAYAASRGRVWRIVFADGSELAAPQVAQGSVALNRDGSRVAFIGRDGPVSRAMVGTREVARFEAELSWPVWSDDGATAGFVGAQDGICTGVVAGPDGTRSYAAVIASTERRCVPVFAPGTDLLVYAAEHLAAGKALGEWLEYAGDAGFYPDVPLARGPIDDGSIAFSPDGRHVAYIAGGAKMVLDGYAGEAGFDRVFRGRFTKPGVLEHRAIGNRVLLTVRYSPASAS